jgi:tripartite-type tricarboxylate transporter receptor subunit TctC
MRPIVSWGADRHPSYPNVPTFRELGYKEVEYYIWAGLVGPRGIPDSTMKTLRDAVRKAVEDPAFKKTMAGVGSLVQYKDAPEFGQYWEADAKRLARLVKIVGKVDAKK